DVYILHLSHVSLVQISISVSHPQLTFSTPPLFSSLVPATADFHTLSLHDALPISRRPDPPSRPLPPRRTRPAASARRRPWKYRRSEEHTSELQSRENLVCRLLLEKKKNNK